MRQRGRSQPRSRMRRAQVETAAKTRPMRRACRARERVDMWRKEESWTMSPMVLISLAVSCVGMECGQLGRSSTAQLSARLRQAWNRAGASHRTHD